MRRILSLRHWWRWFASLLLAAAVLLPAAKLEAQAPQAEEFSQNVKQVYFPLNVYTKVINPAVLDSDAEWLKQHPDAQFWIQGYADIRGDILYNLVLSYRRAQLFKHVARQSRRQRVTDRLCHRMGQTLSGLRPGRLPVFPEESLRGDGASWIAEADVSAAAQGQFGIRLQKLKRLSYQRAETARGDWFVSSRAPVQVWAQLSQRLTLKVAEGPTDRNVKGRKPLPNNDLEQISQNDVTAHL